MAKRKHKRAKKADAKPSAEMLTKEPEGPSRAGPGQIFIMEPTGPAIGSVLRLNNVGCHPLDLAHARGKLRSDRYSAGKVYREYFELMMRSGRDSTDPSPAGGGSGAPWTQIQADAIHAIDDIEFFLKAADRTLVRKFCGEGYSMAEAVRLARVPCHPSGVVYRISEALDHLGRAILSARRNIAKKDAQKIA